MTLLSEEFAPAETPVDIDAPGRYANPNRVNEVYGDPDLHLPPVAETYAARVSPLRREQLANRIASWFDSPPSRGGVRIIDIAHWMRVPLETLHDQRTIDLLELRGIAKLKVPGLRYVFLYRVVDGMPNVQQLLETWRAHEIRTSSEDKPHVDSFEYQGRGLHKSSREVALKIVTFLKANAGKEFSYGPIDAAVVVSTTTIKRPSFEKTLKDLGVRVRYSGPKGKNGSKRWYSYPKRKLT